MLVNLYVSPRPDKAWVIIEQNIAVLLKQSFDILTKFSTKHNFNYEKTLQVSFLVLGSGLDVTKMIKSISKYVLNLGMFVSRLAMQYVVCRKAKTQHAGGEC